MPVELARQCEITVLTYSSILNPFIIICINIFTYPHFSIVSAFVTTYSKILITGDIKEGLKAPALERHILNLLSNNHQECQKVCFFLWKNYVDDKILQNSFSVAQIFQQFFFTFFFFPLMFTMQLNQNRSENVKMKFISGQNWKY